MFNSEMVKMYLLNWLVAACITNLLLSCGRQANDFTHCRDK